MAMNRPTPRPRPNCRLSNQVEDGPRKQCYGHPDGAACPLGVDLMYGEYEAEQRRRWIGFGAFLVVLAVLVRCVA